MKRVMLACLFAGTVAAQQQPPVVQQPVYVTAIEVVADVRDASGNVPPNLTAADFVIVEQGVERPVIGVDYLSAGRIRSEGVVRGPGASAAGRPPVEPPGWQIVLFFDRYLSSASTLRRAADALLARADDLARLGQVSVVVSSPAPDFLVLDTRDANEIRKALRSVKETSALNWLVRHRRQYQYRSDMARARPIFTELSAMAQARELPEFIRGEIMAEVEAVGRFQSALLTAIGRFPRRTPRALYVVSEGFEMDSAAYYEQFATNLEDIRRIRQSPLELNVGANTDAIAKVLAASGWTTIGVHAGLGAGEQWIDDASRTSIGRVSAPRAREALYASERANEPLLAFATETGGSAGTAGMIAGSVARLDEAVVLTYQVSRPPDGKPRSIEVRSRRPGLTIKSFRWATESTPAEMAATRTLALLEDTPVLGGDLPTTVSLAWTGRIGPRREGAITVSSDLGQIASLLGDRQTVFRVTIVVSRKNFPPTIVHRTVTPRSLGDTFEIKVPIEAGDEKLEVAATVEELSSGLWGGQKAGPETRGTNP